MAVTDFRDYAFEADLAGVLEHFGTVDLEAVAELNGALSDQLFEVRLALDGDEWDGIYLGRREGKDLVYAGKVDHGFDKVSAADLKRRLTPLVRKTQAFSKRIAHKGIWVEPKLLAEIEYRAKSAEGKVRHPFFKGLREDI